MSQDFILITGCSGGGKSSLIDALAARRHHTIAEPGRRVVEEATARGGKDLPWIDMKAFATRALDMAWDDLAHARALSGLVFFDRGVIDAAVALAFANGPPYRETLRGSLQYAKTVFLAPPWPEIFVQDAQRRHDFRAAAEEHDRIDAAIRTLGYTVRTLPKVSVEERAEFVLNSSNRR